MVRHSWRGTWVCLVSALVQNEELITKRRTIHYQFSTEWEPFRGGRTVPPPSPTLYIHTHSSSCSSLRQPLSLFISYRSATLKNWKWPLLLLLLFVGDCGVGCGSDGFGPKPQSPYLLTTTTVKEKLKKKEGESPEKEEEEGGGGN